MSVGLLNGESYLHGFLGCMVCLHLCKWEFIPPEVWLLQKPYFQESPSKTLLMQQVGRPCTHLYGWTCGSQVLSSWVVPIQLYTRTCICQRGEVGYFVPQCVSWEAVRVSLKGNVWSCTCYHGSLRGEDGGWISTYFIIWETFKRHFWERDNMSWPWDRFIMLWPHNMKPWPWDPILREQHIFLVATNSCLGNEIYFLWQWF